MIRPARVWKSLGGVFLLGILTAGAGMGCHHKDVAAYLADGDAEMRENRLPSAEEDYRAAAKLAPKNPRVHLALGNLYLAERNYPAAQTELLTAMQLDPRHSEDHAGLARLYAAQSQLGQAENQWRAAIALDPTHPEYYQQLAQVLQRQGKGAEAERELRTAAGLAPNDAHIHLALGNLLDELPEHRAEAVAEFARVRELDPSLAPATPPPVGAAAAPVSPAPVEAAAAPPPAAPAPAISASAATSAIKPVNKKFLLSHSSPVYQGPDSASQVVAHVHRGKRVMVVGLTGEWLQVRLRTGTIGFVPASAVE